MQSLRRKVLLFFVMCVLVVCLFTLSLCIGAAHIPLRHLVELLFCGGSISASESVILRFVRLPRSLACILGGAALSASGAIIQNVLKNPLGSPNIIGVNAGAGFFVVLASSFFSAWTGFLPLFAFTGAFCAILIVSVIGQKAGNSHYSLILAGVVVNTFFSAFSDSLHVFFPDSIYVRNAFRIGSFASVQSAVLVPAGACIILALVLSFVLRNGLDVLALGDEVACSLGLNVRQVRTFALVLATLLSGAAVSFCGLLGFVGLIVPHCARRAVGNEMRFLLPFSAVGGSLLVLAADFLCRVAFAPYEVPVGIFLALIGGPFFFVLLVRQRRHDNGA